MVGSIDSEFGELEAKRRAQECALREREDRARKWAHRREKFASGLRQLLTYAVLITLASFIWLHKDDLQRLFQMEENRITTSKGSTSTPSTTHHNSGSLNHQSEIDQASQ